jgi:hypothetical protein
MKRILLFLLLFCFFVFGIIGGIWGQSVPGEDQPHQPEPVHFEPLIEFNFDFLWEMLSGFLADYYGFLIAFFFVYLILGTIKSFFEGRQERLRRERVVRLEEERYERNQLRADRQVEEKRLQRERALIRKYTGVDEQTALRIQTEMYRKKFDDEDLQLAPIDDDVPGNNVDRGGVFWKASDSSNFDSMVDDDNSEFYEDTATINNSESSTVIIPKDKRKQDRFYRSMEDDYEGGGY